MTGKAVLFSEMTPDAGWEGDFNDWYDTEHIPARMAAPGFTSAQRYKSVEGPAYLAVYEMESAKALATPEYKAIKGNPSERSKRMLSSVKDFTRYIGEELGTWRNPRAESVTPVNAPFLYAVFFSVPSERTEEFDRWYEEDHIPALLHCPDWSAIRRLRIAEGEPKPFSDLALHYLASPDALHSEAREAARRSPWRARLAQESWFKGHYVVFKKMGDGFRSTT